MNYKALEDLINILVKKAGYNVNEGMTLEDIDVLTKRLGELSEAKEKLERKISSDNYVDKEEKAKDLEEKKYIENTIDVLSNQPNEGVINENEVEALKEQARLLDLKIESRSYEDKTSKSIDELHSRTLEEQIDTITGLIKEKHDAPSELGLTLLEAFKNGKPFEEVRPVFEKLISLAMDESKKTVDEIDSANIFELMEKYAKEKDTMHRKIQKDSYSDKEEKNSLDEKKKYHTKRITAYNKTLDAIEARKKELKELVEESRSLYSKTREDRINNEEILKEYTSKLYAARELTGYAEEFGKYLDYLKDEILGNKVLEDKYSSDVIAYDNEIRTLDLNIKNVNSKILEEENCLEVIESKLEALDGNKLDKINDELAYLVSAKRLESLTNEQQYFYVNVDTIKTEIANLWNKGNNEGSYSTYNPYEEEVEEEKEEVKEEPKFEDTSMYSREEEKTTTSEDKDEDEIIESIDELIDNSDEDEDGDFDQDIEIYDTLE